MTQYISLLSWTSIFGLYWLDLTGVLELSAGRMVGAYLTFALASVACALLDAGAERRRNAKREDPQ